MSAGSDKDKGSTAGAVAFDQVQASTPAMSIAAIQVRLDNLVVAMLAKALKCPAASFEIRSGAEPQVYLRWDAKKQYASDYHFIEGAPEKALAEAEAWIAALPTPEQKRLTAFLESLDETIQLGKNADVDVEAINPLMEIMKRISKNALTHHTQPPAKAGEAKQ